MHTAFIKKLSVDRIHRRVVSVSDDKTARVWDLQTGRLIATLRIPISAAGHEGQLYAGAVSPDGKRAAVAGYTGLAGENDTTVYFFDLEYARRAYTLRLNDAATTIDNLAYSDDGRFLAVCLSREGRAFLMVFETRNFRRIALDAAYQDHILGIDFSPDGRLVTTSVDGYARLYDARFKRIKVRKIGNEPFHAYFSPDGSEVAIGFNDAPRVAILSGVDLSDRHAVDVTGLDKQKNLIAVAWSDDGHYLHAGGESTGEGSTAIYRWDNRGRGRRERYDAGPYRISDLHALPDGGVVYSTGAPSIGVLNASGDKRWHRERDTADFMSAALDFRVSPDGSRVQFPYGNGDKQFGLFSSSDGLQVARNSELALLPPLLASPGMTVSGVHDGAAPKLNGQPLPMDKHESPLSYALAADPHRVLLGTTWALRLYDRVGRQIWAVPLSQMALAVNVSANGRWAVGALSDGSIRWFRMADGLEALALFPHRNGRDWVLWTPKGFYLSSPTGDQYIGWHLNRGKDKTPDFYKAVQLERLLFRPEIVQNYVASMHAGAAAPSVPPGDVFDINRLAETAPPRIDILSITPAPETPGRTPSATLRFAIQEGGIPIRDYNVFVNGIPVIPTRDRILKNGEEHALVKEAPLELYAGDNLIRVESSNGQSLGIAERYLADSGEPPATVPPPGDLYVLAVGVNTFPELGPRWQLHYAASDADDFAKTFRNLGGAYFKRIFTKTLSDNQSDKPTGASIVSALNFLQQAQGRDTVILYLSSHGISDPQQNYYLVPRDAIPEHVEQVENGQSFEHTSLIAWETFFEALRNAAGKRLLVVDSCKARNIGGRFDAQWVKKRSASAGFALLVSSKGSENSLEDARLGHGLFTYALLDGLQSACDGRCEGDITLRQLYEYASSVVQHLRSKEADQQTPQLEAPAQLDNMPLLKHTHPTWVSRLQRAWRHSLNFLPSWNGNGYFREAP
ncbi:caspase family protein [Methylococcus sp. EFPC2]|uniref:caspase family protein n=1 Tax=Methylococcus sp. EFPC2 TaxID=2812648 RepID=UPI0019671B9D|nr:caspase family protein [Methylococcus sp. EFPC2]QSA97990.1 caspase family protein [Methylococcus sp. EFPC2]